MNKSKTQVIFFILLFAFVSIHAQTMIAPGEQPQITINSNDYVRLVYGHKGKIFYATSFNKGKTFSKPVVVAELPEMHLGMTRGPHFASSKDYSLVTAMDKKGNIHSFRLTHKTGKWEKLSNVNDINGSAPEGLMSISADDNNNFYAVWLDLREDRKNNICFSSFKGSKWSKNKFAYKSPESHVCECCKPSIAVNGNKVSIMFRNWLKGSRDLYLITSTNSGESFTNAQRLGNGTWPLKGCPMDGGGLIIDSKNNIHTAWQRDGIVYYDEPGKAEEKLGEGRSVGMNGDLVNWEKGSDLFIKKIGGAEQKVGEGTALKTLRFTDNSILAIWENSKQIVFKTLAP
jgi:hypothetical protein